MTKKKQSKRTTKQAAKKGKRSGVDPTLHEMPALSPHDPSGNGQDLSAPAPIVTETQVPDLAAVPSATESLAAEVEAAHETAESEIDVTAADEVESNSEVEPPGTTIAAEPEVMIAAESATTFIEAHQSPAAPTTDTITEPHPAAQESAPEPLVANAGTPDASSGETTQTGPSEQNPAQVDIDSNASGLQTAHSEQTSSLAASTSPFAALAQGQRPTIGLPNETDAANQTEAHALSAPPSIADGHSEPAPSDIALADSPHGESQPDQISRPAEAVQPEATKPELPPQPTESIGVAAADIPTPEPIAAAIAQEHASSEVVLPQVTTYDITALNNGDDPAPDIAAMQQIAPNPLGKAKSLGRLTRSKSSYEVSRALPGKDESSYKWTGPIDYFGASAAAFSTSFAGNTAQSPSTIQSPGEAQTTNAPAPAQDQPPKISIVPITPPATPAQAPANLSSTPAGGQPIESPELTPGLSPKMAKFISSLRERGIVPADNTSTTPTSIQMESTSVELTPTKTPVKLDATMLDVPAMIPSQMEATSVDAAPLQVPATPIINPQTPVTTARDAKQKPASTETSRELEAFSKALERSEPLPQPKALTDDEALAPKPSSPVAELRESIISEKDGKTEDWHPVSKKKSKATDPAFTALTAQEVAKPKGFDSDRHLTLEEMAALDPALALHQTTSQQPTIRSLKSKTTAGVRFEIYLVIYIVCLGLGGLTEQTAGAGTCRDAGQRIETSIQLLSPKTLADNFIAGLNAFDDREIKLHPFNPNKRPNFFQILLHKIFAFCAGLSSAFGRIPGAIATAGINGLAQTMILLSYLAIFIMSVLIYFKFRRSMAYGVADMMLLPICLLAAFSGISAVITAVLSMSESLAVGYLPNTVVVFTMVTFVIAALDMARRSFLGRKQAVKMRD